jgi:hypothetical protein
LYFLLSPFLFVAIMIAKGFQYLKMKLAFVLQIAMCQKTILFQNHIILSATPFFYDSITKSSIEIKIADSLHAINLEDTSSFSEY